MLSQWILPISVDPTAPVNPGKRSFILSFAPISVDISTAEKTALSESASTPTAPTHVPAMLKHEKSLG